MALCMDIILTKIHIDDSNIRCYLESVLENAADEFESVDDVYNAVGPILESSSSCESSAANNVMEVCQSIYNAISESSDQQETQMKKLDAPVYIANPDSNEIIESTSIWISKPEKKSTVNQKKLEKAEAKIKQKQDKKDKIVKNSVPSTLSNMEASASQSINRKDVKTESSGKFKVMDIHIENFDIAFGSKILFEGANLHIACGRRYGLVGRNGMGKTTLLKMISTRALSLPQHMTILHVEQEVEGDDTVALQSVLESDTVRENLLQEERQLHNEMENKTANSAAPARLTAIYSELADIEADKAPAKAAVILSGLGFTPEMQKMTTKEFSGGWRMRLALARALFGKPDLLLLDAICLQLTLMVVKFEATLKTFVVEPTNMLDIRAIMWLEDYMQEWPNTALIVSHDRSFLESVCTDILHLTSRQLDSYRGSYEQFLVTKDEKLKNRQKEYEAQKQYRDHIQIFIDRFRYNANRASQVQSKLKLLEKLPKIHPVEKEPPAIMRFPSHSVKLTGTVLRLDEVLFHYMHGETIFKNVNISAGLDSRICIVGENGSGKTTLLKILNDSLEPISGFRHTHQNLRIGYFTQHHVDQLDMGVTSVELLASKFPGRNDEEYRHQLGSYGITGDLALRPVSSLSGGQKSRVAFALMSMSRPNFLILDEPTNHLDMETIEALGIAINDFSGGVILVSHDERLIRLVCRELWLCGNQSVKSLEGGIETYRRLLEEEFKRTGIK